MKNLIDLLPEHLKDGIKPAEERLLEAVQKGDPADFRRGEEEIDKPEKADKWGNERIIRSEILYWLCTSPDAIQNIHTKGIQIWGAKITGFIDFEGASIPHILRIMNCFIEEEIILMDAKTKTINLFKSLLKSFTADRINIEGTLVLKKVIAKGVIRLLGANINGDLNCNGASFENAEGDSFRGDGLTTKGSVFLDNVTSKGAILLPGAKINGNLGCTGASFESVEGYSFIGDRLSTKDSVVFNNITSKGVIRLLGANINGDLDCTGASFEDAGKYVLITERAKIGGVFFLNKLKKANGRFNFSYMNVGQFVDDENSWPNQDNLILTGFEYKGFGGGNTPTEADKRIQWIRLQDKKYFSTQPYEQLAKVYRQIGHESDAREVMIAKQEDLRKYGKLSRKAKFWNWFLGETIGHGYKPLKAVGIIIVFLIFGIFIFSWANNYSVMQPSKERVYMSKDFQEKRSIPPEYPQFNPIMYSMDVFVPFLDLHQEDYWLPDASKPYGFWFRIYFWLHILLGWVFSTLTAASLTGLIRKE
ncbi:MAG: hypothetical protein HZA00_02190 [Nitrospinae bacterium]|nr:hypothetical protein [Nitrospinota bacterium]